MILFKSEPPELLPIVAFASRDAAAAELAAGSGEAHAHIVHIAAGGEIGPHVTGFGQLFVVLDGSGWVAGDDGERVSISAGEVAYFARGEGHSKGSATGLRALMIQVYDLHLSALTASQSLQLNAGR
jgi:quercetin dioxygenase-like cupin family protein